MPMAVWRLKRRPDFLRVAGLRRKWAAPGLILQAAPMPEADRKEVGPDGKIPPEDFARVGFTVSKKVGNSVARNRARRRLKAAAAEILPHQAASGYDYVVIGRQETLQRSYSLLLQDLQTALKRLGVLKRPEDNAAGQTAAAANRDGA